MDIYVAFLVGEMAKLVMDKGLHKKTVQEIVDEMNHIHNTGKITIRKKPEPRSTTTKKKFGDNNKAKGQERIIRHADLKSVHTSQNMLLDVKEKKIESMMKPDDQMPDLLKGCLIYDHDDFELESYEHLMGIKVSEDVINVYCIINDATEVRYLTSDEAKRFRDFGYVVEEDVIINNKNQEYHVPK